jgi:ABC-type oligopeptide transport system substrate-binding subunit
VATARLAGAAADSSALRQGGIFRYGTSGASVQVDPQLAYISTAWWLEYATAAKLYNYSPGGKLVPEVAAGFAVSDGGKRYTFTIRKGFRFSDGTPVTASSFEYAFDRVANHDLASPGGAFITDPNSTNIVGAKAVSDGHGTNVSGVTANGNRLVINLTKPDGTFLSKLTMPFFQATSRKLPLTQEVVSAYPSAGPYVFTRNEVNVLTSIRRNPYWKRGPGRTASRRVAGVDVLWNLNEETAYQRVLSGALDETPVPSTHAREVADRFGVNKTRFWSKAGPCLGWIPFNSYAGLFKNNAPMRRAVSWALDRRAYVSGSPPYARTPWTHLLPPGFPGSVTKAKLQPYAATARIAKARKLAAGHFKDGKIVVAYRSSGPAASGRELLVRRDLIRLGFEPENVEMKPYSGAWPTEWDLIVSTGFCVDLPDPYAFFGLVVNWMPWSADSPKYRRKVAAANGLTGNARLKAFGKLDLEIMRNLAPIAVMHTYNNRYLFSSRVDPRSLVYHHVYSDWSIPALALK